MQKLNILVFILFVYIWICFVSGEYPAEVRKLGNVCKILKSTADSLVPSLLSRKFKQISY